MLLLLFRLIRILVSQSLENKVCDLDLCSRFLFCVLLFLLSDALYVGLIEAFIPDLLASHNMWNKLNGSFRSIKFLQKNWHTYFLGLCGREIFSKLKFLHPGVELTPLIYDAMIDSFKRILDKADN